jgi:hypothetical protein
MISFEPAHRAVHYPPQESPDGRRRNFSVFGKRFRSICPISIIILLDYPNVKLANMNSEFYWEEVNFGLKPTLRIVQAIIYRGTGTTGPVYAVAMK